MCWGGGYRIINVRLGIETRAPIASPPQSSVLDVILKSDLLTRLLSSSLSCDHLSCEYGICGPVAGDLGLACRLSCSRALEVLLTIFESPSRANSSSVELGAFSLVAEDSSVAGCGSIRFMDQKSCRIRKARKIYCYLEIC